ncbi:regulatory protein, arsR family [Pedobacter antarcticus]|nr:regulatory protein, arsR family [Pedobacter antarcticus]
MPPDVSQKNLDISIKHRNIAIYIMGLTKTEIFTAEQNQLATLLKAMAHPARIAILQRILKSDTCICGDLVEELGLAQATISQHLKELKNAGIIQGTIEGVSVCYCIHPENWKTMENLIGGFLNSYKGIDSCC